MENKKIDELESYFKKFSDVPKEVILKEDLLRLGLRFSKTALDAAEGCRFKSYRLFTYDKVTHDDVGTGVLKTPEDLQLKGGPYDIRRTVISVRLSQESPYIVDVIDNKPVIAVGGVPIAEVKYPKKPDYYSKVFDDGTIYSEVGPLTSGGQKAFFTVYRICQFWGAKEECKFCDINQNVRQAKKYGMAYVESKAYKNVEQVAEVAAEIFLKEKNFGDVRPIGYTITGGAIIESVAGKKEDDFYLQYVQAIKAKIGHRWPCTLQTGPKDGETYKRYKAAGVDCVDANIEVWGKDLFRVICPGKDKYVGWDEWIKRVVDSVDIFGEGNVCPNLVPGVEMAEQYGFKDVHSALRSTIEGLEYLMSRGVVVRFNQWNISPLSALAGNPPIPLEYFIRLDQAWCEIWTKYNLPLPRSLGQIGPGAATWFNSAVLDMDPGACRG